MNDMAPDPAVTCNCDYCEECGELYCECECSLYTECGEDYWDRRCGPGDCGRLQNGVLTHLCTKAGTEECDFECPYSGGRHD